MGLNRENGADSAFQEGTGGWTDMEVDGDGDTEVTGDGLALDGKDDGMAILTEVGDARTSLTSLHAAIRAIRRWRHLCLS